MKRITILMVAMVTMLGCSLSNEVSNEVIKTAVPSPTQMQIPTSTPQATAMPTQVNTVVPTATTFKTAVPVVNCTPRADWPVYVVLAGDTLGGIAQRAGSTIADLSAANCLTNANNIFVGQQLRVPRIPAVPTLTPVPTPADTTPRLLAFYLVTQAPQPYLTWSTSNVGWVTLSVSGPRGAYIGYGNMPANGTFDALDLGMDFAPYATFTLTIKDAWGQNVYGPDGQPVTGRVDVEIGSAPLDCPALNDTGSGDILVSPVLGLVNRCSYVSSNQTLWVTWEGVSDLSSAEYYFMPTAGASCGVPGTANVIGVDQNMADGNMITWYIGQGPCAGILYAFGYSGETLIESRQHALVVYSK